MARFLAGAALGSITGAVVAHYATTTYGLLAGIAVAVLVWFGVEILSELFD